MSSRRQIIFLVGEHPSPTAIALVDLPDLSLLMQRIQQAGGDCVVHVHNAGIPIDTHSSADFRCANAIAFWVGVAQHVQQRFLQVEFPNAG